MNRAVAIVAIAAVGLIACGADAKSPAPAGTQVMTDNTAAMTENAAAMTDNTAAMTDGSTSTRGG